VAVWDLKNIDQLTRLFYRLFEILSQKLSKWYLHVSSRDHTVTYNSHE